MIDPMREELRRQKEEEIVHERVRAATAELNTTRAERQRLLDIARDVQATPDGAAAVRHATTLHNQALARLSEALRELQEFLDRRRGPPGLF